MHDRQINAILACGRPLSGKWKMEILYLLSGGPARWSELTRSFPTAAPNVLTRQLRQMEQEGLILRSVSSPKPPQVVEYALTAQGTQLIPTLQALHRWDLQYRSVEAV